MEESAEEVLTRLKRYAEEESAEEVLARLERYAASLRAPPPASPVPRAAVSSVVHAPATPQPAPVVDTLIPTRREPARRRHHFAAEVAPALIAVSTCALLIVVFEVLDPVVAGVAAAALGLVGVIGLVQRVPLARAWTIGLVVAAVLIRIS